MFAYYFFLTINLLFFGTLLFVAASSPTLISGVANFSVDPDDLLLTIGTLIALVFCLLTTRGFLGLCKRILFSC